MQYKIKRRSVDPARVNALSDCPPLLARIYAARGVSSSTDIQTDLSHLLPPNLLGMEQAVSILKNAIESDQRILIVGDFDADGATSTAVAYRGLRLLGAKHVDFIVPDRFKYGYGLSPQIVEDAREKHPDVLVTVDNGISSIEGVALAKSYGMQVVVTDHHIAPKTLPSADAIVNPNQPNCPFESKHLAGVGVMFYVLIALRRALASPVNLAQLLDIVALGTVADVVPLDANNRILVHQGLRRIRAGQGCVGIQALLQVAGRESETVTSSDCGFALGPRLNAAGRLEDMGLGIRLLITDDKAEALRIAAELNTLNQDRRQIESNMQEDANTYVERLHLEGETLPLGLCLYQEDWHAGVVGILSSRIKDKYHRPVICFTQSSETLLKGSARSVPKVHIRDVLDAVATKHPGLITQFGGHAMAAGLSIVSHQFDAFAKAFDAEIALHLTHEECVGELLSDGPLMPDECNIETALLLELAGPFGQCFEPPLFDDTFKVLSHRIMGEKHVRLTLQHQGGAVLTAVQFYAEDLTDITGQTIHIAYEFTVNRYQGNMTPQLLVRGVAGAH